MKTLTILILLLIGLSVPLDQGRAQEKEQRFLIGVLSSEEETRESGTQIPLNVPPTKYVIVHRHLTVKGKRFHLFKYSKSQIEEFEKISSPPMQKQRFIDQKDYYIRDDNAKKNEGRYCLVKGIIDEEKQIIYSASVVKIYDEDEVIEALMKYSESKIKGPRGERVP
jgi:hypothetical protein